MSNQKEEMAAGGKAVVYPTAPTVGDICMAKAQAEARIQKVKVYVETWLAAYADPKNDAVFHLRQILTMLNQ